MFEVLLALLLLSIPLFALAFVAWAVWTIRGLKRRLDRHDAVLDRLSLGEEDRPRRAASTQHPASTQPQLAPTESAVGQRRPPAPPPVATPPTAPVVPPLPIATPESKATVQTSSSPGALAQEPKTEAHRPTKEPWWSGLEENLGARLPVWIGAVAIVLAAAFLVKISFERGWLGPSLRVTLGALLGVALLVGGERLRRTQQYLAQGLSSAGVAALFVSVLAATSLYQLLPTLVGFALLALTAAVAVLLALRQGPMVAVIGLIGGFLSPALIGAGEVHPGLLLAYLLILQIGILAVSRQRQWWLLGLLALGVHGIWALVFVFGLLGDVSSMWIGVFVLSSVAAFLLSGVRDRRDWGGGWAPTLLVWSAAGGGLTVLALMANQMGYGTQEWLYVGLLAAGCAELARRDSRYLPAPFVAAAVLLGLLAGWSFDLASQDAVRFLVTAGAVALSFGLGGFVIHRRSASPAAWATLASTVPIGSLLVAYRANTAEVTVPWGGVALLLAGLFVVAAAAVRRHHAQPSQDPGVERPAENLVLAIFATAAAAGISLALPMELDRRWLTIGWALLIPALLWIAERLQVAVLRKLAWALLGLVAMRLLLNPEILHYPLGQRLLFNGLLLGYGVPCIALAAAATLARRQADKPLYLSLGWTSLALAAAHTVLQVRQYFFPGQLATGRFDLLEIGLDVAALLILALGARWLARRWPDEVLKPGSLALAGIALAGAVFGLGLGVNPLLTAQKAGETWVFNRLLLAYGLPTVLFAWFGVRLRSESPRLAKLLAVASLAGLFTLVTLEVRQAFQGPLLNHGAVSSAESYAYSVAWILLGVVLVVAGIVRKSDLLRQASLAAMLPAIFKVFLLDTSQLDDLYRVLSLLALGVSLFLLAYLYRRFVFPQSSIPEGEGR